MKASTTSLSMNLLRDQGYMVDVGERWIPNPRGGPRVRRDLFGILDLVAVKGPVTLGVQTTTKGEISKRAHKMAESPATGMLHEAGWILVIHGWSLYVPPKGGGFGRKRYEVEIFEVSWDQSDLWHTDGGDFDA